MVKDTILYDRLQIQSTASESEIKKAFYKLSLQCHPDKHPDEKKEEATKNFAELTQARDILMDSQKRSMYDQVGMEMFSNNTDGNQGGGGFPFGMGGFPFPGMGGFPFPGMDGMQKEKQIDPVVHHQNVTLEQIYSEDNIEITYEYQSSCKKCTGEGTKTGKKSICSICQGNGKRVVVIQRGNMIQQMVSDCPNCQGKGSEIHPNDICPGCTNGAITKKKSYRMQLNSHFTEGHNITVPRMGNHIKDQYSDLIIVFHILPNHRFFLHHDDLFTTVSITLYQAMYGFQYVLYHMDERKLLIHSLNPTACNEIKMIPNEGMRHMGSTLFIIFDIILPLPRPVSSSDFTAKLRIWNEEELRQSTQSELQLMLDPTVQPVTMNPIPENQYLQFMALFYNLQVKNKQQNQQENQHQQQQHNRGQPQCVQQ